MYITQVKESFIEGNEDILLKEKKKNLATQSNHKKLKRNISPELAFENLTPSQKSLFKQKTLPLVSCIFFFLHTDYHH